AGPCPERCEGSSPFLSTSSFAKYFALLVGHDRGSSVDQQFTRRHVDLEDRPVAVVQTPSPRLRVKFARDLRRLLPRELVASAHRVARVAAVRRHHDAEVHVGLAVLEARGKNPHAIVDRRFRTLPLRAPDDNTETDAIAAAYLVESRRPDCECIDFQTP